MKPKLKRDIVGSIVGSKCVHGVYVIADKDYKKGQEIYFGQIKANDREMFDKIIKVIK